MTLAIVLFAATYVLMISFGKWRTWFALASGILFIVTGMLPANQIIGALDFNVLLMIGGTMGLVQLFIDSHMSERMAPKRNSPANADATVTVIRHICSVP